MVSSRIAMHDELLVNSFRRFDVDGSGYVTIEELKQLLGETLPEGEVDEIFKNVDASHDGKIDYQEWIESIRGGGADLPVVNATLRHIDSTLRGKPEHTMLRPIRALTR